MKTLPSSGDLFYEAIQASLHIEEPAEIVNSHLEIVRDLLRTGNEDYARAMLPDTLLRIRALDDPRERAYLMRLFIGLQCDMGVLDDAVETQKLLDFDPEQREAALKNLAVSLAEAGRIEEAERLADEIEDLDDYELVLKTIGKRFAADGRFADARTTAERIEPGAVRVALLCHLAAGQWKSGAANEAVETMNTAVFEARRLEDVFRDSALADSVTGFLELHMVSQAMSAAQEIRDARTRLGAQARLAVFLHETGNAVGARSMIGEAGSSARTVPERFHRAGALRHIGEALEAIGEIDEATVVFRETLAVIRSVENGFSRTEMLTDFAARLAASDRDSAALRIFRFAREAASEIDDLPLRTVKLGELLERQAGAGFFDEAGETADRLEELRDEFGLRRLPATLLDRTLAVGRGALAAALLRNEMEDVRREAEMLFQRAIDTARRLPDPLSRAAALRELAVHRSRWTI